MSLRPLAATALLAAAALAGDPARAAAPDLPEVGDVDAQLALDVTPVPEGMGAIFVPSATRPELEPVVHVFAGDAGADRVATAPTGRRIPVPPGAYAVTVGQGPPEWRPRVTVTVEAGKTAVAPAFFGAVRVLAIDRYDHAVDTPYSVVSADGARVYGPERTSDSAAYRATRTWLLAPGNYYLVPGGDPDALDGRIALPVAAGARLAYRLVLDDAERVVRTEFPDRALVATESLWRLDWVLGGSFAFDRAENELAGFSGDALRLGAFTRLEVGVDAGDHLGVFKLGLDEDFVGLEHAFGRGLPFQKLTDLVTAEILYNYRLAEIDIAAHQDDLEVRIDTPRGEADLHIVAHLDSQPAPLPATSPFRSDRDARRFAGPLPWTFDHEAETNSIVMIHGHRSTWKPQPTAVDIKTCTFLDQSPFAEAGPVLANAFHVAGIDYGWDRGVTVAAGPGER
ncbi:MAG: hypothetical protein KC635_21050 [Myxococcales bacterium]|nr:hypothetical protein [Myxococcales bacterium]